MGDNVNRPKTGQAFCLRKQQLLAIKNGGAVLSVLFFQNLSGLFLLKKYQKISSIKALEKTLLKH
ncbi:hypothetical protein DIU31_030200 [Mucilaginibacter rubeus]|uniref:Uncharacterized protein n=1 Tax=Mucilaginibacter rubeus TaxID=2027860 RepID=A0AAE6MLJ1_9SPHI|nr:MULTISPECIES: hypothetical protein [Mucilaginibacter]QEM07564.1 hypothetical protein DIU31_030200 [Mucilaginibacter rubeus]QEM20018.1 hypothetical protein DIU38_029800 [Mucilaginibacter gossypii]QTE43272.1 hypothetical protein J3L19_30860 [Mucilaginibacter rubeus]QTE49872.1 hypothetical protein J3L21_30815 [Mucilaginibacter rubeus]QTE65579.1 hypothetical protein J3L22_11385 [Mucilaginibacter rubeus]